MAPKPFAPRVRRALLLSCTMAATLLSLSCGDAPTGDSRPGFGSLTVRPQFTAAARFAPVTLDRVQVLVERVTVDTASESTTRDTLVNTTRNFSVTAEELRLSIPVPISGNSETVSVTLSMYAGPTLLFFGSQDVDVTAGRSADASDISVTYIGPGSNAIGLIIEPFDTTVAAGSLTPFRATAINSQEQDIGPFYMRWSLGGAASGASIDAAGRLRASAQAGTVWVRGNLPNGVDDSVLVTITGAPRSMTVAGGDHQSGEPGTPLELSLSVLVTGSGGTPVAGIPVTWAATIGGGSVEEGTTLTDVEGIAQTLATLGPNPGLQRFTASSPGLGSVVFSANEAQTGTTVVWQGDTGSTWSVGGNWVGGVAPDILDSVVIPSAEFYPVLDTTPIISALTLTGNGRLTLNAHGLVVIRGFASLGDSYIEMTDPSDVMSIGGNALFDGGDSRGHLTAGGISFSGNFTQRASQSGQSFSASGTHVVSIATPNPTVSFATPGLGAGQSSFNDLVWGGQGTMTLGSSLRVAGTFIAGTQSSATITSSNASSVTASNFSSSGQLPIVFNNVLLSLSDTVAVPVFLSNIVFQNMPTNRAQLSVSYPGGAVNFNALTFSTTPVAPNGFYLDATDTVVGDGSSLQVRMLNPTPNTPGSFFRENGDAEVVWPVPPAEAPK